MRLRSFFLIRLGIFTLCCCSLTHLGPDTNSLWSPILFPNDLTQAPSSNFFPTRLIFYRWLSLSKEQGRRYQSQR